MDRLMVIANVLLALELAASLSLALVAGSIRVADVVVPAAVHEAAVLVA